MVDLTSYNVKALFSDLEWGFYKNWEIVEVCLTGGAI